MLILVLWTSTRKNIMEMDWNGKQRNGLGRKLNSLTWMVNQILKPTDYCLLSISCLLIFSDEDETKPPVKRDNGAGIAALNEVVELIDCSGRSNTEIYLYINYC